MQGNIFSSLGCSNTMSKISDKFKNQEKSKLKYKNVVEIPAILGFVEAVKLYNLTILNVDIFKLEEVKLVLN